MSRSTRMTDQPYPWLVPDLFRWFALLLLNLAGLAVAWWGTSGTARLSGQFSWVDVGVAAVVVGGLGNMTWLLQGRRALALRRRTLLAIAEVRVALPADPYPGGEALVRYAVPGTTRYHRGTCAAIFGRQAESMSADSHKRAGRRACGICDG